MSTTRATLTPRSLSTVVSNACEAVVRAGHRLWPKTSDPQDWWI